MFTTHIRASHFNLIACASASQRVLGGDEPWGLVTALLCAGATSVTGTQWEIQSGTAREYFTLMYMDILRRENGEGSVVDLAVALQKTVRKLKKKADFREPYHWAPFVLYGSWFMK
jgi:CHAT domain-containing protein